MRILPHYLFGLFNKGYIPSVTLKFQGKDDIRFKTSEKLENIKFQVQLEMREVIMAIVGAVYQAYLDASSIKI